MSRRESYRKNQIKLSEEMEKIRAKQRDIIINGLEFHDSGDKTDMNKKGYIIICGGCGTENHRYYLPATFRCSGCGERYSVEEWRDLGESE